MKAVIVVTGANNGIGLHMTKTLLEDGYCVAVLDISDENLAPLKSIYAERLLVFDCDVTDRARVNDTISAIVEKWGQVDVLVNNFSPGNPCACKIPMVLILGNDPLKIVRMNNSQEVNDGLCSLHG